MGHWIPMTMTDAEVLEFFERLGWPDSEDEVMDFIRDVPGFDECQFRRIYREWNQCKFGS